MKGLLKIYFVFIVGTILLFDACSKTDAETTTSTAVPYVTVNVSININSSSYATLATVGGVAYLTNVGYRGIVLYRLSASQIAAFDRTCTYDLPDANGIVVALTGGIAECPECNSIYNLGDGSVNTEPTTMGLTEYKTFYNASTGALTITN